jgi:quercetin dioxygenase-like cupin family protein
MNASSLKLVFAKWASFAFSIVGALLTVVGSRAADENLGAQVKSVLAEKLPNVPGKSLTAVLVSYPPGGKSARHRHAGSVYVYVLSGIVRSENSATGPAKIYTAGESFFEPPGSEHLIGRKCECNGASELARRLRRR